jgi:hypothetical protein
MFFAGFAGKSAFFRSLRSLYSSMPKVLGQSCGITTINCRSVFEARSMKQEESKHENRMAGLGVGRNCGWSCRFALCPAAA